MTSCPTCIEPYNESKRKLVNCAKCNFQCCLGCIKTYLVSTVQLPNCMNCKVEWNDELMRDVLSHHWITTKYAKKRKVLLFDIERSLLPATMEYVERQIILDQGAEDLEIVKPLMYMIKECASQFNHVGKSDLHLFENAKKLIQTIQETSMKMSFLPTKSREDLRVFSRGRTPTVSVSDEKRKFIKPCPETGCKGFLSTAYKCGLCNSTSCPKCFEVTHENLEHTCKTENILSADLIRKESKGCPTCGVMIFKLSGCDQMWCTSCNTGFSWNTGKVATNNNIHNPHYFQWLATQNRVPNAERGGRENTCLWGENRRLNYSMTFFNVNSNQQIDPQNDLTIANYIMKVIASIGHIYAEDRPNNERQPYELMNRDIRVCYLRNLITEDKFKSLCLKRINQREFDQTLGMIYDTLNTVARGIVNSITRTDTREQIREKYLELKGLIDYYNDHICKIYEKYKRGGKFNLIKPDGLMDPKRRLKRSAEP